MTAETPQELLEKLGSPRIVWLMVPAGKAIDEFIFGEKGAGGIASKLSAGDIVIDGGNSFYRDSQQRAKKLEKMGIHFFDSGTSGGIHGEVNGFSLMVGGPNKIWPIVEPTFQALAAGGRKSYGLVGPSGAGHFVKMVHNGIEYGMMEAIGEGFAVLDSSEFDFNLREIAGIWREGSVVSSWLIELTREIFDTEELDKVIGFIHHTGEGKWTIEEAKKLGVDVRIIEQAFAIRQESAKEENQDKVSNKIVALLRKQFGGHEVKYKE